MKSLVPTQTLARILILAQLTLSACAVLLLGYCAFVLLDAWIFQKRESRDLDRLQRRERALSVGRPLPAYAASPRGTSAATGDLIGRIVIPRIFLTAVVVDGTDKTALRRGVGHIPGTSLPGEQGNVGLAGHRDTLFRLLKDLRPSDEIQFSTFNGEIRYVVEAILIVDPEDVGVLAPTSENMLTLVTCYPFFYIGPAPKRFVVRARQSPSPPPTPTPIRSTVE